jgi:outer membrane protein OmpA-like peptidoglycan-associated protein
MTKDRAARATTPARLGVVVTATLLGGMIAAVAVIGSQTLEPRLTETAEQALRDADLPGMSVRFDGREAFLSSASAAPGRLADAKAVVEGLAGVRWATVVAADASTLHASLTVSRDDAGAVVTGTVGTQEEASALEEAAQAAFGADSRVDVQVLGGVAVASWGPAAGDLLDVLAPVRQLDFRLEDRGAALAGFAADPDATEAAVRTALGGIPLVSALIAAGPTDDDVAVIEATVIRFAPDSVVLDAAARAQVAALARDLARFPGLRVRLIGHIAIATGTAQDALAFSERRASVVAQALEAHGVDAARIEIAGAGDGDPLGDNGTPAGAAENRRVTVVVLEVG